MMRFNRSHLRYAAAAAGLILLGGALGLGLSRLGADRAAPAATAAGEREVLYWYDPMVPDQKFDRPGKSPFMDMDLVPRYADEAAGAAPGVRIDPALVQSLGARYATVRRGTLEADVVAPAVVEFNDRNVAVVQARAAGFVERVYNRAPGDVIRSGAPLADLLVPEWAGAQLEYLAVRRAGDAALTAAARQRLILLGMPEALVAAVERTGRPRATVTMFSPIGGAIRTLGVRAGMSVTPGMTLAEVNGLSTVWLNAAIPQAVAGRLRVGRSVEVTLDAFPGERMTGRLIALLPEVARDSRTLTARIEMANPGGRLRPGMYGQIVFGGGSEATLLVPSEAVIRTGRRTLVMLALEGGRYQPAEVRVGREAGGLTQILAGLNEGERVVASGQFLLDSEASLSGVEARSLEQAGRGAGPAASAVHRASGRVQALGKGTITLAHGPVPALQWPTMTMTFLVPETVDPDVSVGDQVDFTFDVATGEPTVRSLTRQRPAR